MPRTFVSGFEKRVNFVPFIKCHYRRNHTSYANAHRAYFHTLSECISGTGAAIEAQQSVTQSSSSVLLHSTTGAMYEVTTVENAQTTPD